VSAKNVQYYIVGVALKTETKKVYCDIVDIYSCQQAYGGGATSICECVETPIILLSVLIVNLLTAILNAAT
jgi:hypothetical protein